MDNTKKKEVAGLSSLKRTEIAVNEKRPRDNLLRFEVSSPETIEKLLSVKDLTLPTEEGQERNIIGKIYDQIIKKLTEHNFPEIKVIRNDPNIDARDNFDNLLFFPGNLGRSSTYTRYTDDDCVPVSHAEKYRNKLRNANIIIYKSKNGHFNVSKFPEIVKIIKSLKKSR